ncbi:MULTISPECIES: hypothetical protein [unclassified Streptomyces]|uniref:hypothetical protein n=1 Tax=unclassified Streptomyces TaxID=2593676 RepID=UPI00114CA70B|nr:MULTISPECIES: hypothetical protein [unclassified Streptomyces]MYS24662.1 hypothetical protein [Streptomyces sp. SID4948]
MNYIDSEHLVDWVAAGRASVAPTSACSAFHEALIEFPWTSTRIDWRTVKHVTIDAAEAGEKNLAAAAAERGVALYPYLLALFSPGQPGLICAAGDGLDNLDYIYWKAPGIRYFCGVDLVMEVPRYHYRGFGEFDGFSKVTFRT